MIEECRMDVYKSENEGILFIWFSMGTDHSNPNTIHSTTVLCDTSYKSVLCQ